MTTTDEPEVTIPAQRGPLEPEPPEVESLENQSPEAEPLGTEPPEGESLENQPPEAESLGTEPPEGESSENEPPRPGGWRGRLSLLQDTLREAAGRLLAEMRRWPVRQAVAGAVVVALLLAGGGLLYAGHRLRDPDATRNRALTDTAATSQVTGDVSNALGKIFAYTPKSTQSTAQAARDLLDGSAATQYQTLFAQIRQRVADQQLTLTTRVVRAGVVSLTSNRATLLVFLDQTAQRAGAPATSAAAQLSVIAHLVQGQWRISDLKAR